MKRLITIHSFLFLIIFATQAFSFDFGGPGSIPVRVDNTTIVKGAGGVLSAAPKVSANGTTYYTPYILAQSAVPVSIIQCNTGITWTLAANPANGKTRITSSGAHGLTTSPAVGKSIYITGWTGTGVAGLYNVATVVDTTNLDIDLTYAAGLGNPTVVQANTEVTLATVTVPGGAMGPNGLVRFTTMWGYTNSSNSKSLFLKMGGSTYISQGVTTTALFQQQTIVRNRGVQNSQIGFSNSVNAYGTTANAAQTSTLDTAVSQVFSLTAKPSVANEYIQIEASTTEILPGA